jgi:hypothetical protein
VIRTEEEAKTKWCPFVRFGWGDVRNSAPGINRCGSGDGEMSESKCIGSACMAWRWQEVNSQGVYRPAGEVAWIWAGERYAQEPTRPEWMASFWTWDKKTGVWRSGSEVTGLGFCGLAERSQ